MSEEESPEESEPKSTLPKLTFAETRVLGCLLEKEATTPDHYPLTHNALHSACNQASNRDPVTDFGTDEVEEAMEGLRYKQLGMLVHQAGARVPKCKHTVENKFPYMTDGQRAALCVLLLRGQQTVGEIRQRTERMHPFADIERCQTVLDQLAEYTPEPIVKLVPAGGGRRVATYVHLLGEGGPAIEPAPEKADAAPATSWREEMEEEIQSLKSEILELKSELDELKSNLGA